MSLLMVVVGFYFSNQIAAQCVPDTAIKVPGFYPAAFPEADVDKPYSATNTILSIKDTVVFGQAVIIDSTVLRGVIGLPPGISYQCLNNKCVFFPSIPSCVEFSGTPTQAGTFPLKMAIMIYAKIGGALPYNRADTIRNFSIKVNGMNGLSELELSTVLSVMPNPVTDQLHVASGIQGGDFSPSILDAMGRKVEISEIKKAENGCVMDVHALMPGIYFVTDGVNTKRFIKI